MKFEKEFKEAISNLPSKEKDKLLLRLLKKDLTLTNRLYFELIDNTSVDKKRQLLEDRLKNRIASFPQLDLSPGNFMMYMRDLSGEINEHVNITKDKYGEVILQLLLINESLAHLNSKILSSTESGASKFCTYVISRAFKILILTSKLHEDLHMEFEDDIKKMGELISDNQYLMMTAIRNGLDVNWLLNAEIPENIEQIHKEIRSLGFLR